MIRNLGLSAILALALFGIIATASAQVPFNRVPTGNGCDTYAGSNGPVTTCTT
jgi:hypothetical protein